MDQYIIFNKKTDTIYTGYKTCDHLEDEWVEPTWGTWDPNSAFGLTLDDFLVSKKIGRYYTHLDSVSEAFTTIIEGLCQYNSNKNNKKYEYDLLITTAGELKKLYAKKDNELAYLRETSEEDAIKLYKETHKDASIEEAFHAGSEWNWQIYHQ